MERALKLIRQRANADDVLYRMVVHHLGGDTVAMLTALYADDPPRTQSEVAAQFGISQGVVSRRVRRARLYLDQFGLLPDEWRR
jgi:DNA-directed RNA polymerase specialized sigma subunit